MNAYTEQIVMVMNTSDGTSNLNSKMNCLRFRISSKHKYILKHLTKTN